MSLTSFAEGTGGSGPHARDFGTLLSPRHTNDYLYVIGSKNRKDALKMFGSGLYFHVLTKHIKCILFFQSLSELSFIWP